MKSRSTLLVLGGAVLLTCSLFSYSRSVTTTSSPGATTTATYSFDGAALAVCVFAIALFVIGRRILRAVRQASIRAGMDPALPFPRGAAAVLALATPFLVYGQSSTFTGVKDATTFAWGSSSGLLLAYLLFVVLCWMTVLLRRLRELSEFVAPPGGLGSP